MDGAHTLNVVGFLKSAKQLERRFDMLMSRVDDRDETQAPEWQAERAGPPKPRGASGPGRRRPRRRKPPEPPSTRLMSAASGRLIGSTVDKRLFILSGGMYGGSSWSAMFCIAAATREESVANECRAFLRDSVATVARLGLHAWLCDLIDDARQAAFTGVPSSRMPLLIRSMGDVKLARQCTIASGARYISDRRLRSEVIVEHCEQTHRFAAYSLLQWGNSKRDNGIAFMLLTRPNIGAAMLHETRATGRGSASRNAAARRIAEYLAALREQADRQYAWVCAQHGAVGFLPEDLAAINRRADEGEPDSAEFDRGGKGEPKELLDVDRRYLFDARHVIAAYRGLWNLPDDGVRLAEIGHGADPPSASLWRNRIYLRMIAEMLLGAASAADLADGFAARDRERFERGVARLEQIVAIVRNAGLTAAPTLLAPSVSPNFGELKRLSFSERDRRLRVHARVEADMAAVMLAYLPDPDVARQAGAALIRGDLTAYAKVVGDWRTRLRVRMPCT